MTVYKNSGLAMAMESARAAAKTITGITQAAPGVITSVAHGYANGDIVLLVIDGMTQLNNRAYVVQGITTDTFQLQGPDGATGVDTTDYDAFTAGSAYKITLGTSITGVQGFSASGGDPQFLDITTVHDKSGKQVTNGTNPISYSLTMQWDPGNAAQQAMLTASEAGDQKVFRIRWPNGRYMMFYGDVSYAGVPGGDSQGVTTSPAAMAVAANPTFGIV